MLHKDVLPADRHPIHSWEVADAAALAALVPVTADVGKIAKQVDTEAFYLLTEEVGPTWVEIGADTPVSSVNGATGAVVLTAADVGAATVAQITAAVATALINAQTGTTYTLVLGDAGYYVRLTNAAAIALTVPANAAVAFPVGTIVHLRQGGAGQVTVAEAGGVTVNTAETLLLRKQHATATLIKVATDTWDLTGDLELA